MFYKMINHDKTIISISNLFKESAYHINIFYVQITIISIYICHICKITFQFNNKLHQHVQSIHRKFKTQQPVQTILSLESEFKLMTISVSDAQIRIYIINIIKLNAADIIDKSECNFHNWHYMTMFFQFSSKFNEDFVESVCLNTECIMLLINQDFF